MSQVSWSWSLEHVLPSEHGAGHPIIEAVRQQLADANWSEQEIFGIRLALEEALVNAIRHGNRLDRAKQVHVACKLSQRVLRVEITDQGEGFNPNDVPDCTDPERLELPCGRGIMLMRCYMTRVEYNDTGNLVVMEKERGAHPDGCCCD